MNTCENTPVVRIPFSLSSVVSIFFFCAHNFKRIYFFITEIINFSLFAELYVSLTII